MRLNGALFRHRGPKQASAGPSARESVRIWTVLGRTTARFMRDMSVYVDTGAQPGPGAPPAPPAIRLVFHLLRCRLSDSWAPVLHARPSAGCLGDVLVPYSSSRMRFGRPNRLIESCAASTTSPEAVFAVGTVVAALPHESWFRRLAHGCAIQVWVASSTERC